MMEHAPIAGLERATQRASVSCASKGTMQRGRAVLLHGVDSNAALMSALPVSIEMIAWNAPGCSDSKEARAAHAAFKSSASYHELAEAGHAVPQEQPAAVAYLLAGLVDGVSDA